MANLIRVFIIDDHEEVRRALVARLRSSPEIEIVGDSGSAEDGLEKTKTLQPDVLLIETKRADGRGIEIVDAINQSGLKTQVIVLTSYTSEWERLTMYHSGAARYLLKDIDSAQLIDEIRTVVKQGSESAVQPNQ
ncbi:MAG TPA: response regulator transcription factor [Anaerolineales bacterium]|nr:response regulator transcription factor [Anaerolineales bacterium]